MGQSSVKQARVAAGDVTAAGGGVLALPAADNAACFLDDGDQRDDIERLEFGLRDDVHVAKRKHAIEIAVAAEAPHPHRLGKPVEADLVPVLEHIGGCRGKKGLGKIAAGPRLAARQAFRTAVPRGSLVAPESLAGEGLIHDAKYRGPLMLQADQCAPERKAENEGARAVDGIESPKKISPFVCVTELLSRYAMVWKLARYNVAHDGFRPPVGGRYRIESAPPLVFRRGIGAKVAKRHFARFICEAVCSIQQDFK